jgi:hypothetical protein
MGILFQLTFQVASTATKPFDGNEKDFGRVPNMCTVERATKIVPFSVSGKKSRTPTVCSSN